MPLSVTVTVSAPVSDPPPPPCSVLSTQQEEGVSAPHEKQLTAKEGADRLPTGRRQPEEATRGAGGSEPRAAGRGPAVSVPVTDSSSCRHRLQSGAEDSGAHASGEGQWAPLLVLSTAVVEHSDE